MSPHLDDAAFSCGGTLSRLARSGWRVVVATVFTLSVDAPKGFALACQLDKGLGPEVDYMALRRAEDRAAMEVLGLERPVHVPLPEAPHRGYGLAAALFGPLLPDDHVAEALRDAVGRLVADHTPDLLLAPQAIGGHVDHVQVVAAVEALQRPTLWWRDFPYGRTADAAEPFRHLMHARAAHAVRLDAAATSAKRAGCLAYASQLGFQFGGPEGLDATLAAAGPTETFCGASGDLVDAVRSGALS